MDFRIQLYSGNLRKRDRFNFVPSSFLSLQQPTSHIAYKHSFFFSSLRYLSLRSFEGLRTRLSSSHTAHCLKPSPPTFNHHLRTEENPRASLSHHRTLMGQEGPGSPCPLTWKFFVPVQRLRVHSPSPPGSPTLRILGTSDPLHHSPCT